MPLTSYLAEKISLEAAFLFGAVVSMIAFVGILVWLPSLPVQEKMSYGKQLGILRKPQLWFNIVTVIFIFAAMFSVYSYFAEYLGEVTLMNGSWISMMLMVFGIVMIFGNFLFGGLLHKNLIKTVIMFPLLYMVIYVFTYALGASFLPMIVVVLIWGPCIPGLIISQTWLTTEAKEAPEFGNSLFVSFSNLGITMGAAIGGWFISHLGIHQLIWSGLMFALLAFLSMIIKIKLFNSNATEVNVR